MKIYIDTEFNEFGGQLISMALVAENHEEFYEVLECKNPGSWVEENVIPVLEKDPVPKEVFEYRLQEFLNRFDKLHIIADWPEDLKHFCDALIIGPGISLNHPDFILECRTDLSSENSKVLHNALHDARAIADQDLDKNYEIQDRQR